MNQDSNYAVVTNWCYNFALKKEEKEHNPTPVNNRIMADLETRRSGYVDIFSEPGTLKLDDAE